MNKQDVDKCKIKLYEMLAEIKSASDYEEESAKPVKLDQSSVGRLSRMDAMQSQQMSIELIQRQKASEFKIKAALSKIDNDEFGFCEECDELIYLPRLQLDPSITFCIDCAQKRE